MSGLTRYVRSTLVMLITLALVLAIMAPVTAQEGDTPAGEPPPTTLTEETATGASGDGFTGVVADAATLNVRSGPGQQFPAFTTIPLGQSVELLGRDRVGAWLQARLSDGRVGWISSQFVLSDFMLVNLPVVDETPQTVAVTAPVVTWTGDTAVGAPLRSFGNLIVRTGPGLNFPVLVTLPVDQTFVLQGRTADGAWLQVRVPDGRLGWVARTVITTTLDLATLPTVTTEAVVEAPPATEALAPGVGGLAQGTVVDATNLNVRTGPGLEFTIMSMLPLGSNVVLEGRNVDGAWLQVRLADGRLGWVSSTFMTANLDIANLPVTAPETPAVEAALPVAEAPAVGGLALGTVVEVPLLNVRSGPGLEFGAFTALPLGESVVLEGRDLNGFWLQIRLADGRLGWVSSAYMTANLDIANLPVTG